jgi:transcriptional regulator with XRE-family HTH domain
MAPGSDPARIGLSLFVDEMRAAREQAGWTQADLAAKASYSTSLIAMIETGERTPQRTLAIALDKAFGTPGTFLRMYERLRGVPFPAGFRPFTPYESQAKTLRSFEMVLVPGLLQTPAYARAVLSTRPDTSPEEVEELVRARLARQAVLGREDPPRMWVLLDEHVLRREVGGRAVMREQLEHLAALAQRQNITIQVIPYAAGPHSGLLGAFAIAEMDGLPSVAYVETATLGETVEDSPAVAQLTLTWDSLRSEALPGGASRELLTKVIEERWM